jgi:hypothetical protein
MVLRLIISRWREKEVRWLLLSDSGGNEGVKEGREGERERTRGDGGDTGDANCERIVAGTVGNWNWGPSCGDRGRGGSPMRPSSMPSCPTTCFDFVISPHSSTMSLRSLCSPLSGASFASWCLRRGVSEGALLKTAHPYPNRHLRLLPLVAQSGKW